MQGEQNARGSLLGDAKGAHEISIDEVIDVRDEHRYRRGQTKKEDQTPYFDFRHLLMVGLPFVHSGHIVLQSISLGEEKRIKGLARFGKMLLISNED